MIDTAQARKARGAFFTPDDLSSFVAEWAVRTPRDTVLEPSCGEAAFLLAIGDQLRQLGSRDMRPSQLQGVEIHDQSVANAFRLLISRGYEATIHQGDFFEYGSPGTFDVVVGNPPYVRYQNFSGEARAKAQEIALGQGVRLPGLASSWAAFVIHAAACLKPEGRLGLILPAELLTVNYASPIRQFLLRRFASVKLVLFDSRVFPGVLEEVVLLLAEGTGPTDSCTLLQARDLSSLPSLEGRSWCPREPDQKWTDGLISAPAFEIYSELRSGSGFSELLDWGRTDLGMVTGNNQYFTLSASTAGQLSLPTRDLLAISPPSSRHLRGLAFTEETWSEMAAEGSRVYLFYPDPAHLSEAAAQYIGIGAKEGVERAYKCRVRTPWWRVPLVRVPDLFLTYMNHDTPRLVSNDARVPHLNSVHGVTLKEGMQDIGRELLPIGMLNSVTLLGAELVGRSYGGGLLKVEPKEADRLPLPSPATLHRIGPRLRALRPQFGKHLRNSELLAMVKQVDRILLAEDLKMPRDHIHRLREAREVLFARRAARAGKRT